MSKVQVQAKADIYIEVEAESDEEAIEKAKAIPAQDWEVESIDTFEGFDTLWLD